MSLGSPTTEPRSGQQQQRRPWAEIHAELMARVAQHPPVELKPDRSLAGAAGIIRSRHNLRAQGRRY